MHCYVILSNVYKFFQDKLLILFYSGKLDSFEVCLFLTLFNTVSLNYE